MAHHIAYLKVGSFGFVTIPAEIRNSEDILPGDWVRVVVEKVTPQDAGFLEMNLKDILKGLQERV